jgi:phenylalanyl-tRNA synthetase beta chain
VKVSLRWLRDYATLDAPIASIAKALVDTGTEVGAVEVGGEGLVVARIAAVAPVPGSSHLQFADIDMGEIPAALAAFSVTPGTVRVMTGAPNVKEGQLVPYAPPGSRPPAMDDRLGVKTLRGHKSPGMLCSISISPPTGPIVCAMSGSPGSSPPPSAKH